MSINELDISTEYLLFLLRHAIQQNNIQFQFKLTDYHYQFLELIKQEFGEDEFRKYQTIAVEQLDQIIKMPESNQKMQEIQEYAQLRQEDEATLKAIEEYLKDEANEKGQINNKTEDYQSQNAKEANGPNVSLPNDENGINIADLMGDTDNKNKQTVANDKLIQDENSIKLEDNICSATDIDIDFLLNSDLDSMSKAQYIKIIRGLICERKSLIAQMHTLKIHAARGENADKIVAENMALTHQVEVFQEQETKKSNQLELLNNEIQDQKRKLKAMESVVQKLNDQLAEQQEEKLILTRANRGKELLLSKIGESINGVPYFVNAGLNNTTDNNGTQRVTEVFKYDITKPKMPEKMLACINSIVSTNSLLVDSLKQIEVELHNLVENTKMVSSGASTLMRQIDRKMETFVDKVKQSYIDIIGVQMRKHAVIEAAKENGFLKDDLILQKKEKNTSDNLNLDGILDNQIHQQLIEQNQRLLQTNMILSSYENSKINHPTIAIRKSVSTVALMSVMNYLIKSNPNMFREQCNSSVYASSISLATHKEHAEYLEKVTVVNPKREFDIIKAVYTNIDNVTNTITKPYAFDKVIGLECPDCDQYDMTNSKEYHVTLLSILNRECKAIMDYISTNIVLPVVMEFDNSNIFVMQTPGSININQNYMPYLVFGDCENIDKTSSTPKQIDSLLNSVGNFIVKTAESQYPPYNVHVSVAKIVSSCPNYIYDGLKSDSNRAYNNECDKGSLSFKKNSFGKLVPIDILKVAVHTQDEYNKLQAHISKKLKTEANDEASYIISFDIIPNNVNIVSANNDQSHQQINIAGRLNLVYVNENQYYSLVQILEGIVNQINIAEPSDSAFAMFFKDFIVDANNVAITLGNPNSLQGDDMKFTNNLADLQRIFLKNLKGVVFDENLPQSSVQ